MRKILIGTLCILVLIGCSSIQAGESYIPLKIPSSSEQVSVVTSIEPLESEEIVESVDSVESVESVEDLGSELEDIETITFRVTAYCSCETCCGKWALNRPLDENGNEIVYGAAHIPLRSGVSCASPLPFGTEIDLGELGIVVVEDRTADWVVEKHGQYIIDLYFTDHETASAFGVKYVEGVIL